MDRLVALQEPEASESSFMSDSVGAAGAWLHGPCPGAREHGARSCPHAPPIAQDKDLALARLLQEQENAFMFLGGSSASHRWGSKGHPHWPRQ